MMANQMKQIEDVRGSGIYPGTGPLPPGGAIVRTPADFGHPEQRHSSHTMKPIAEERALAAGRAIFGGYFLYNGINHFVNREMMATYAKSKGVPAANAAVVVSGVLAIAGGMSLLTGLWPKIGAGMISTFLLGVSPAMHAFWREQEPQPRMHEMVTFTKNMALIGASLFAAAHPEPWPLSLARPGGQMGATMR